MDMTAPSASACPGVTELLSQVGAKWTIQVIVALAAQSQRFNELRRAIDGVSQQRLTAVLKALERDGIVDRRIEPTNPPQVHYSLTEVGHSLALQLQGLGDWATEHQADIRASRLRYGD